ncbi:hypothetical protein ACFSVM_11135 [Paenibacillus shunpengii]|uniref:Uncharacterized protein n=2 Tax=Paenibacillus TaxID=44249 RepID=A0ABW5SMM8_9BACL
MNEGFSHHRLKKLHEVSFAHTAELGHFLNGNPFAEVGVDVHKGSLQARIILFTMLLAGQYTEPFPIPPSDDPQQQ